jgi:hypothetical protein
MSIDFPYNLDRLVDTFTRASQVPGDYPSPIHAGLAAAFEDVTNEARYAIARNLERYDNRSLYEFAAALDYAIQIRKADEVSCNQNESEAPKPPCQAKSDQKLMVYESASELLSTSLPEEKPAEKLPEASTSLSAPFTPGESDQPSKELCTASSRT